MNILYLHNVAIDSQYANIIQVMSMCTAMARLGINVTLSLPGTANIDKSDKQGIYEFEVHTRVSKCTNNRFKKYFNFHSVINTIKTCNPDLIYIRSLIFLFTALYSRKNIILELHNNKLHERFVLLDKFWRYILKKNIKKKRVKKVVCISQALSEYWIDQGLPKDKIVTAHDAIDTKMFEHSLDKDEARKRLGLPVNTKIVTYAGRLYKNRKIDNIINLAMIHSQALFLIVGGPDEQKDYYQNLVEIKGVKNVIFTGQISHDLIPIYLYASDVLLALWSSEVSTINYCSPLKLFEYMAAGRIIVAHGFRTIKEVLTHNQNAIICDPESMEDLIEKTGLALHMDNSTKLSKQSRMDVFEKHTWAQRAAKILENVTD